MFERLCSLIAKHRDKNVIKKNIRLRAENTRLKIHLGSKGNICGCCLSNPVSKAGDWCFGCKLQESETC